MTSILASLVLVVVILAGVSAGYLMASGHEWLCGNAEEELWIADEAE